MSLHSEEPSSEQDCIGVWYLSWQTHTAVPEGCNTGLAFSGWADAAKALRDSEAIYDQLPGTKFITIGGGNQDGAFNAGVLESLNLSIAEGNLQAYSGIAYDIEEGDSGLADLFAESFKVAKAQGFTVMVTISHSAPYGIPDAASLMQRILADTNVDYISPQLYTTGREPQNDYETIAGVDWTIYAQTNAKIIPSIADASYYPDAHAYFLKHGIILSGFIEWNQE